MALTLLYQVNTVCFGEKFSINVIYTKELIKLREQAYEAQ